VHISLTVFYMLAEILQREAPSFYITLSVRAKIRGYPPIDTMSDEEIINFVRREMGDHVAELLEKVVRRHN